MSTKKHTAVLFPLRTLSNQIKKTFIIQLSYPINFFGGFFTSLFVGIWFLTLAIAVSNTNQDGNVSYIGIGVWGLVAFNFYIDALFAIGRYVRQEQLTGTLESVWMTSANKIWIAISNGISSFLLRIVTNVLIVLGFSIIVPVPFVNILTGLLIFLLELLLALAIGFFYGTIIIKIKNASAINNLVVFITMIISAVFFPFSIFPKWMLWICRCNPFSWIVDAARSSLSGTIPELIPHGVWNLSPLVIEILIIIGFIVVLFTIGITLFIRTINRSRRDGSLSQY